MNGNTPDAFRNVAVNMPEKSKARLRFGSPQAVDYDYTPGMRKADTWATLLKLGRPYEQATETQMGIERHERNMWEKQRASDKDIADRRIAATIATITSNTKDKDGTPTNPHFGDATRLNNLNAEEVQRYLGGSINVEKAQQTKSGDQLFKVSIHDLENKELIQSFHGTTQNIIERFHAYQDPQAQTEMGNAVKKSRQEYESTLEFLKSDPSIKEIVARNPKLMNTVQEEIWNGMSLGKKPEEITAKILERTKEAEEELGKERTHKGKEREWKETEEKRKPEKELKAEQKESLKLRQDVVKNVDDNMKTWLLGEGVGVTPDQIKIQKNVFSEEYKKAVIEGYQSPKNVMIRVEEHTLKNGEKVNVFYNSDGEPFKDFEGTQPVVARPKESNTAIPPTAVTGTGSQSDVPTIARQTLGKTWEEQMQKTPQQGVQEMGESLGNIGLGAENWRQTGRLLKDIGSWGVDTYLNTVNKAYESQRKARERLSR